MSSSWRNFWFSLWPFPRISVIENWLENWKNSMHLLPLWSKKKIPCIGTSFTTISGFLSGKKVLFLKWLVKTRKNKFWAKEAFYQPTYRQLSFSSVIEVTKLTSAWNLFSSARLSTGNFSSNSSLKISL